LIVAASGSFHVLLDDGQNKKIVTLNRPDYGLLVVPGIWRELFEFSSGAICLVLASQKYDQEDYSTINLLILKHGSIENRIFHRFL